MLALVALLVATPSGTPCMTHIMVTQEACCPHYKSAVRFKQSLICMHDFSVKCYAGCRMSLALQGMHTIPGTSC